MPELSIIMPVYNEAANIDGAIKSILNQSFSDFEFIIINDGSNDDTLNIISKYDDKRIALINNNKNIGKANFINIGLNLARGNFIGFMDGDDTCSPNRFELQMDFLLANDLDIVGCSINKIDENDKILFKQTNPIEHREIINYLKIKNIFIGPSFYLTDATILAKAEVFKSIKFPSEVRWAEYFEVYLHAKKKYQFGNINDYLYNYRTSGFTSNIISQIKATLIILKAIKKYEDDIILKLIGIIFSITRIISIPIIYITKKIIYKLI